MVIAEILPEIYLGELSDVRPEPLKQSNISIALNLRKRYQLYSESQIEDGYPTLRDIRSETNVRFIWEPIETAARDDLKKFQEELMSAVYVLSRIKFANGGTPRHLADKTLVFCVAGADRSPLVIALHLWLHRRDEVRTAIWGGRDTSYYPRFINFDTVYTFVSRKNDEAGRAPIREHRDWIKGLLVKEKSK